LGDQSARQVGQQREPNCTTDEDWEVPLNDTARELLRELVQAERKGSEFVFTNPKTRTKYTTIKTAWLSACRDADLSDLRFHDLRHTFGTRAADAGVPLPAIRDVMGHKSIQTTERYAHATDEGKRRAVEAIHKQSKRIVTKLSQRNVASQ
jgi:integrase